MLEYGQRNGVEGRQRPSGHLEKADMKRGRQPVVVPIARQNSSALLGGKGKKVLDLERRQIRRELPQTEKRKLPVLHDATLARQMRALFGRRSE